MNTLVIGKRIFPKEKKSIIDMLCYLIYVKKYENTFYNIVSVISKFELHRTHKFCRTYKLQCPHCLFPAKTAFNEPYVDQEHVLIDRVIF